MTSSDAHLTTSLFMLWASGFAFSGALFSHDTLSKVILTICAMVCIIYPLAVLITLE